MKDLIASDEATVQTLTARLKQATTIAEFQRVQCVLMRVALGSSAAEIAQVCRRRFQVGSSKFRHWWRIRRFRRRMSVTSGRAAS